MKGGRGARTIALVFLLLVTGASSAVAQASQFSGLALGDASPFPDQGRGMLAFANDCFGPGPVREWDDLDSYDLTLFLPLGPSLSMGAGYSGLTDRGDGTEEGSRTDRILAYLAWHARPLRLGPAELGLTLGGGFLALGDFGGLAIQEGWHSGNGIGRPVPETYASGQWSILCLTGLSVRRAGGEGPEAGIALDADSEADWVALAYIGYSARPAGSFLSARASFSATGANGSSAPLGEILSQEDGLMISARASVGFLSAGLALWPMAGLSDGWIGLNIGTGGRRRDVDPGIPTMLCVGFDLYGAASQYYRLEMGLLRAAPMAVIGACAGFGNGWMTWEASGPAAPRHSDYSLGLFIRVGETEGRPRAALEASLGPALRLSFEALRALTEETADPLGTRSILVLDIEGDARFLLTPPRLPSLGLGIGFRWSPISSILSGAGEDFADAPPFSLRIFACSGD